MNEKFTESEIRVSKATCSCVMCGHKFTDKDMVNSTEHGYVCHPREDAECWEDYVAHVTGRIEIDLSELNESDTLYDLVKEGA